MYIAGLVQIYSAGSHWTERNYSKQGQPARRFHHQKKKETCQSSSLSPPPPEKKSKKWRRRPGYNHSNMPSFLTLELHPSTFLSLFSLGKHTRFTGILRGPGGEGKERKKQRHGRTSRHIPHKTTSLPLSSSTLFILFFSPWSSE